MWIFYATCNVALFSYVGYKIFRKFYPSNFKTFEDEYSHDIYTFLCYTIKFDDGSDMDLTDEMSQEEMDEIHKDNPIKYVTIGYMFNGKYMKYMSTERDITFPIYVFQVTPPDIPYYPETILLNGEDVSSYIKPFLGPLCNFYIDRGEPISLENSLIDHPNKDKLNLTEGTLEFISNDVPITGRKKIIKELPCRLIWKRHAAVDPRDRLTSKKSNIDDFEIIENR